MGRSEITVDSAHGALVPHPPVTEPALVTPTNSKAPSYMQSPDNGTRTSDPLILGLSVQENPRPERVFGVARDFP